MGIKVDVAALIDIVADEMLKNSDKIIITNNHLAKAIGVTTGRMSNMKRQKSLSTDVIERLAKAAGMTGRELFNLYNESMK